MERHHVSRIAARLQEPRTRIQVVSGPRQVGKTTAVRQAVAQLALPVQFVTADDSYSRDPVWIEQQWQTMRLRIKSQQWPEAALIIDEIQQIPDWSRVVKKCWDEDTRTGLNLKVLLLGSSRIVMQRGLTESLAGRFEELYMGHWSFSEMEQAFGVSLEQYLFFGGYPGSASLMDDEPRWKSYINDALIETAISRDVLMLAPVQKPALLRSLFRCGSAYSAQILAYNKMLGQLVDAGNTTTLAHYATLLSASGLLTALEKFSPAIIRQRASSPKWQVHNPALMSAGDGRNRQVLEQDPAAWGRLVESAVGAHLLNACLENPQYSLRYWREDQAEVDFVIQKGPQLAAVEVKSGAPKPAGGLQQFSKRFPDAVHLLVGTGGFPLEEFLKTDPAVLF